MKKINRLLAYLMLCYLAFGCIDSTAQTKKVAPTTQALYTEIAQMDSLMFHYFNTQNLIPFKALFSEDLEWYQDNEGLIPYVKVFENFVDNFKKENKLSRKLVNGSLEVHPIKGYGAIEIGTHEFRHMENGKEEIGIFKFVMIWQKNNGDWKITRVISFDH